MKVSSKIMICLLAGSCLLPAFMSTASARHKAEANSVTAVNIDRTIAAKNKPIAAAGASAAITTAADTVSTAVRDSGTQTMRMWNVESKDTGGTLLFSDSPEYVPTSGILYQDKVQGDARVLYYHLNNTDQPMKVAVVLTNDGSKYTFVHVTRGGVSHPSNDYLHVGKNTQIEYFETKLDDTIVVAEGERRVLNHEMDEVTLQPGQLVYGVFDFHADAPVKASVLMYPADQDPTEFIQQARVLPKDAQRLRGTFTGMNRIISSKEAYDPKADGIVYIPLVDNASDRFRTGIDATDGSLVTNAGNYGVLYRIEIPTVGYYGTQYYLSPLGGTYAGAMTVSVGASKPDLLLTPDTRTYFGDQTVIAPQPAPNTELITSNTELSYLGSYSNTKQVTFEYSPPGASNLPVNLILMPDLTHQTLAPNAKRR